MSVMRVVIAAAACLLLVVPAVGACSSQDDPPPPTQPATLPSPTDGTLVVSITAPDDVSIAPSTVDVDVLSGSKIILRISGSVPGATRLQLAPGTYKVICIARHTVTIRANATTTVPCTARAV
jgi:hypothetical protein